MMQLQPNTWRLLGLSVAAGYTGFGLFTTLNPLAACDKLLGIRSTDPAANDVLSVVAPLIGARDLSIAGALYALAYRRRDREMGMVILAGTVLCLADSIVVWYRKSKAQ